MTRAEGERRSQFQSQIADSYRPQRFQELRGEREPESGHHVWLLYSAGVLKPLAVVFHPESMDACGIIPQFEAGPGLLMEIVTESVPTVGVQHLPVILACIPSQRLRSHRAQVDIQ